MSKIKTYKNKIVLLGDEAVGKTSLIRRFVTNKFDDKYLTTVGTKVSKKALLLENGQGTQVGQILMIWDIMGQKGFRNIEKDTLRGVTGAILVWDISRPETLASLKEYWIPCLFKAAPGIPIVVLTNKIDLLSNIKNDRLEFSIIDNFQNVAKQYKASGYMTSALTGENVEEAFREMGKILIKSNSHKSIIRSPVKIKSPESKCYASAITKVTDEIIMDFYKDYGSSLEETIPIIRKQFEKAGLDINEPTIEGLRKAIELLGEVESSFWSHEEVSSMMKKRLSLINQLTK